jgi:hypothetical protein
MFQKFHDRAVAVLQDMLTSATHPLLLKEIKSELLRKAGLRVGLRLLSRFLRQRMNATYRLVRPITQIQNLAPAVLQRQFAAAKYIEVLQKGYRLISVDESVIKLTDHRKRGWVPKLRHNQVTSWSNLKSVNLIAAITSTGEVWYTVNRGITNSETFCFFLVKLVEYLDAVEGNWREHSVIMLDNVNYHRGVDTQRVMRQLHVPVLFLGPYHFRLAPVEMLFSYIKGRDLNPLGSKVVSW